MRCSVTERPRRWAALALAIFVPTLALATFSVDEQPREMPLDPGDLWLTAVACDLDDQDGSCPPPLPMPPPFLIPNPQMFDMDAFGWHVPLRVCDPVPPIQYPGILFSLDDGDPGPGVGGPDNVTELFFYDHCQILGAARGSYHTSATESFFQLGQNPPPTAFDDDVDAFDTRPAHDAWFGQLTLLFSPDTPSDGGLGPPFGPPNPEAHVWWFNMFSGSAQIMYNAATHLNVPDPDDCDIDGIAEIDGTPANWILLFTTDAEHPCGLDPGDIYISDGVGTLALYADDVNDLKIAVDENDDVDIDALAINTPGQIEPGDPFRPRDSTFYKVDWLDYAPSGMPDFSQYVIDPETGGPWPPTMCGATAVWNSFWWFDSELECDRDREPGDTAETEPNPTCNLADRLGVPDPIPGTFLFTDDDWYVFNIPGPRPKRRCVATISTCALRQPGDSDTQLTLFDGCDAISGVPGNQIASSDDYCPGNQSEIEVELNAGKYWVRVENNDPPGAGSYTISLGLDCYPMVDRWVDLDSGVSDDHSEHNVAWWIPGIAMCMHVDEGAHLGILVDDMQACIDTWLEMNDLDEWFTEHTDIAPSFEEVAREVRRSEDVILLLGFYWAVDPPDFWERCGGHYVTVAGVDQARGTITLSDPALNNAEPAPAGKSGAGRVRGPDHADHNQLFSPAAAPPPDHDDAQNVSHDRYSVGPAGPQPDPSYSWSLLDYAATPGTQTTCLDVERWCNGQWWGQNPLNEDVDQLPCEEPITPVFVAVEAMVDVSPVQTEICLRLDPGLAWPENLVVDKEECEDPIVTSAAYDVARGKLCNLRFDRSVVPGVVDMYYTHCLFEDVQLDRFDDLSPDQTGCFDAWFYLVRESTDLDYGDAYPGGERRVSPQGGCIP